MVIPGGGGAATPSRSGAGGGLAGDAIAEVGEGAPRAGDRERRAKIQRYKSTPSMAVDARERAASGGASLNDDDDDGGDGGGNGHGRRFTLEGAMSKLGLKRKSSRGSSRDISEAGLQPRTIRGFFNNVSNTSNLDPDRLADEVERALRQAQDDVKYTRTGYVFICVMDAPSDSDDGDKGKKAKEKKAVRFEIEVCRIAKLDLHGLNLKRLGGDSWQYKRVCDRLVASMKL